MHALSKQRDLSDFSNGRATQLVEFELHKEPLFASLRGSLMYNSANNFWILEK